MTGLFGKPSTPKLPPVPPPPAVPQVGPETGEFAMKEAKRRAGFQNTILAGNVSPGGKKATLG